MNMNIESIIERTRATLGRNVKNIRKREGLSAQALARTCGIPRDEVWAIERGERDVPIDTLAVLAAHLGVSLAELFDT